MTYNQQIISDLNLIREADHELEILIIYKGIPFICKAKIQDIQGDSVWVNTKDPPMACLKKGLNIGILGSDYFEPASAQVLSFDILHGIVELGCFTYKGLKLGGRMLVRVEPKEPMQVLLENEGFKIVGKLTDLSMSGLGASIENFEYTLSFRPGSNVLISLQLPTGDVEASGIVMSATKRQNNYRLSIRFTEYNSLKIILFKYLIDRRAEISQELFKEYETTMRKAQGPTG